MGYFDMQDDNSDDDWGDGGLDDNALGGGSTFDVGNLPNADTQSQQQVQRVDFDNYGNNTEDEEVNHKGIAKFAIICGVVVLIFALIFIAMTNKANKKQTNSKENQTNQTQQTQSSQQGQEEPQQANIQVNTDTSDNWVELDSLDRLEYSSTITSDLTVTQIKYYACVKSDSSIEVKATVTGNISGLVGTYSIDVPYSKGLRTKKGSILKVSYSLAEMNGKNVIDNLVVK